MLESGQEVETCSKEISNRDRRELRRAIELAQTSECNQKHGAVIKVGGRVIGVGVNKNKNHPDHVNDPKTQAAVHAEIAALKDCGPTPVAGGTIYVARWGKNKTPLMSKPCLLCQEALRNAGIRKVVYTVNGEMEL